MAAATLVLLPFIRLALFFGCRLTLLPWLFGEAKHAALDGPTESLSRHSHSGTTELPLSNLPVPVTSSSYSTTTTTSRRGSGSTSPQLLSLSPSAFAALLLSLSFEEGVILFVLVLLQAMNVEVSALITNWRCSLFGIVALAACFIPLGLCVLLTYTLFPQSGASALPRRLAISLLPFSFWLLLFLKVPLPTALSTATSTFLDSTLARTAVVGVTLIALLSGSGAMGATMDSYDAISVSRGGYRRREPTAQDVRSAEASFNKACEDLSRTKREIERLQAAPDGQVQGGLLAGLGRTLRGSPKERELKTLQLELSSLSMLASSMRDELDQLRVRKREAEYRTTFAGRIWLLIGHGFAAYCVMRLVMSFFSLLLLSYSSTTSSSSSSSPDIVSRLIAEMLHLFSVDIDVMAWSKQISLLLVGVLIVTRLRAVLNYLAQFFRAASAGVSTSFLIMFLSEIMAIYLLATLIQLRTSLPPNFGSASEPSMVAAHGGSGGGGGTGLGTGDPGAPPSPSTSSPESSLPQQQLLLLSTLPDFNTAFGALFDATFLLSALVTLLSRWFIGTQETVLFGSSAFSAPPPSDGR